MKLIVLGATGMLGSELVEIAKLAGHEVTALGSKDLDLTSERAVMDCRWLAKKNCDFVINCAAFTAVDLAESEPERAWDVNYEAVVNLCQKLAEGPRILHVSTDYVFDGRKGSPYTEEDEVNPLGVYGRSKLEGEYMLQALLDDPVIFRTSWLFGKNGKSFPRTILRLLLNHRESQEPIRIVSDQRGCPTSCADLSRAIIQAVESKVEAGVYHACGIDEDLTWFDFGNKLRQVATSRFGDLPEIMPIPTEKYSTAAERPKDSRMTHQKLASMGIQPWRTTTENLEEYFPSWLALESYS